MSELDMEYTYTEVLPQAIQDTLAEAGFENTARPGLTTREKQLLDIIQRFVVLSMASPNGLICTGGAREIELRAIHILFDAGLLRLVNPTAGLYRLANEVKA